MNTRILVISLSLLAASAHASFELLLVADNGSSSFATRAIHRFDPVSGAFRWNSAKPELHRWCRNYFASRREDA